KLRDGVFAAGEALQSADSRAGVLKAAVLLAATTMMGLPRLKFSPFFTLIHERATNWHPSVTALYDWILESIDEQAIMRMAVRTWQNCGADDGGAAIHFIHPGIDKLFEDYALLTQALTTFCDDAEVQKEMLVAFTTGYMMKKMGYSKEKA